MSDAPPPTQTPPPPRMAPERTTNGFALASLVLGIVGFLINPLLITSILAVIFGIIGLRRAPALGRRNLAIIGIVLAVIAAVVSIVVTSAIFGGMSRAVQDTEASQSTSEQPLSVSSDGTVTENPPTEESTAPVEESEEPTEEAVPAEYQDALAQAENYSETIHLSKAGLYDQLVSEYGGQFPKKAAKYAINHVNADWNANALAQAQNYRDTLHLSRAGLHDQLTSEYGGQFTDSQADYALEHLDD